jgi:exodeoxyribonuclease-3
MKLATYNLNGIRARLPRLIEWLEREQPDVVALQELKCADESLPIGDIEAAGYAAVWHGQKGFNGVAILARGDAPALRRVGLPGDPDDAHSRYIEAEVKGAVVGSLYLPNGNPVGTEKFAYKLSWMRRLEAHARTLLALEEAFALAGDFNVIPEPEDCDNPPSWADDALFQPESRAAFRALKNLGLTEANLAVGAEPHGYTFWDYQAGAWQRNHGIRIDHVLLSPQATDRLQACEIHRNVRAGEKPSDHVPVVVTLAD